MKQKHRASRLSGIRRCGSVLLLLVMALPATVFAAEEGYTMSLRPSAAEEDAGASGALEQSVDVSLPDTLTVKTGYAVWTPEDYEEAKNFQMSELETMDQYLSDYTFIDEEGRLLIVRAQGVLLTDLLMMAGIEMEDVEFLHFLSAAPEENRMVSFSKEELLETDRYCNYSLTNCYDEETGTLTEHKRWMAEPTEVMIAFQDCWIPAAEGGSFEEDCEELLTPWNRFRLIFGQTDCLERDVGRAAGGIHTILVQRSGEPPEEPDTSPSGEKSDEDQPEEGAIIETPENGDTPEKEEPSTGIKEPDDDRSGQEPPQSAAAEPPEETEAAVSEPVAEFAGHSAETITASEEDPSEEDAAVPLRLRGNLPAPAVETKIPEASSSEKPSGQETSRRLPSAEPLVTITDKTGGTSPKTEAGNVPPAAEEPEEKPSDEHKKEPEILSLTNEVPETTVQEKPDSGDRLLETPEIQELPEEQAEESTTEVTGTEPSGAEETSKPPASPLPGAAAGTSGETDNTPLQPRNLQKTASPSKEEKSEADREGGYFMENAPRTVISESYGSFTGELVRIGASLTEAVEEEPAEAQPSDPEEFLQPEVPLAGSEPVRLIPVTILEDTGTAAVNPLLAPVKYMVLVLFLLGGLIEYIHYYKEMGPFS